MLFGNVTRMLKIYLLYPSLYGCSIHFYVLINGCQCVHNFSCGLCIFTISEIKMKNHFVLLFSSPFFSLSSQSCDVYYLWWWFYSLILFFSFRFHWLSSNSNLLCIYPYLHVEFLRNIHARFFTFNPIDWTNFHCDYFVKFTIHTRLRLFIRITYTLCVWCCTIFLYIYFFSFGELLFNIHSQRKKKPLSRWDKQTNRQTHREKHR